MAAIIAEDVEKSLFRLSRSARASVEEIQDRVEATLINQGHVKTAHAYIVTARARQARQAAPRSSRRPTTSVQEDLRGPPLNMDHGVRRSPG